MRRTERRGQKRGRRERRRGKVKGVEGAVRKGWLRVKGGGSLKLLLTVVSVSKCCYDHSF